MSPNDPFGLEKGPEGERSLESALEGMRPAANRFLEELAVSLRLPREDVAALAVVLFAKYLDMAQDDDTIVLVVKGRVTPYDTALEAMCGEIPSFATVMTYLKKTGSGRRSSG